MTTSTQPAAAQAPPPHTQWYYALHPTYRLVLRWALIAISTLTAFRLSLASLIDTVAAGGLGGYVLMVPLAGILAAIGVARRERTELPIHDRQTDVIVGTMGLVFALLLHAVLLQRYALYFHLLRLDFLAMWMFVLSASVVLFGLRPVTRFAAVWVLLLMVFPLPYYLLVTTLGGGNVAAGGATLIIAGAASGIAVGRTFRRGIIGALAAWAVGLLILVALNVLYPDALLVAYQQIPPLSAIAVVGIAMFLLARRGATKRVLDRKVEPLAAKQVWAGVPLVLAIAIALAFVQLPSIGAPPVQRFDSHQFGGPVTAPAGWHSEQVRDYTWVERLHGEGAHLMRQQMVADVGNPQWDSLSRPRTLVVDTLTTNRPFSFNVYFAKVLYSVTARRSVPRRVDLGFGVTGEMLSVVDDDLFVTWNLMQWTWRNGRTAQRVLVFAADDHDDDAPFPQPSGGIVSTLNTLFTVLFRGNSAVFNRDPEFKDADLLTDFSRALVRTQLQPDKQ